MKPISPQEIPLSQVRERPPPDLITFLSALPFIHRPSSWLQRDPPSPSSRIFGHHSRWKVLASRRVTRFLPQALGQFSLSSVTSYFAGPALQRIQSPFTFIITLPATRASRGGEWHRRFCFFSSVFALTSASTFKALSPAASTR